MDPQAKAKADFDIAQFKARIQSNQPQDSSPWPDNTRECVFAHAAFALLDKAVEEYAKYLHSQRVPIRYKRKDTAIIVSLGLNRVVYELKLGETAVAIVFAATSPYTGDDRSLFATPWPADLVPIELLDMPIRVLVEDMRAFLLNGTVPS
ncbi:MAG: hypothetical protein HY369_02115 [Candidatus Aenigmarchaeota archaeon]|nr:hypothetical protein [Candidatus Aenigmarchaeota archaeon]